MSIKKDFRLLENYRQIQDSLAVTVKIGHTEAIQIVVADLMSKYKSCLERKDVKNVEHFEKVLKYYLTEKEFKELYQIVTN